MTYVMAVSDGSRDTRVSYGYLVDAPSGFTFSTGFPHPSVLEAESAALKRFPGAMTVIPDHLSLAGRKQSEKSTG